MDLKLTGRDLTLANGDLALTTGTDAVAQHLAIRLRAFRGEWELNREVGMPYLTDVFTKLPDEAALTTLFKNACRDTPGVAEVINLKLVFDRGLRKLIISDLRVRDEAGNIIEFGDLVIA